VQSILLPNYLSSVLAKDTPKIPQLYSLASLVLAQISAVQGLLHRLLPSHFHIFVLKLVEVPESSKALGFFDVEVNSGEVKVTGTSGVELAVSW
jgi:Alpha-N-acetylglucosaminidase (NAGLU) N-terminal domain